MKCNFVQPWCLLQRFFRLGLITAYTVLSGERDVSSSRAGWLSPHG